MEHINEKVDLALHTSPLSRAFKADPRTVKKIKASLIEKAQIKKQYSKVKRQREEAQEAEKMQPAPSPPPENVTHEPSTAPHPDRQILMDNEPAPFEDDRTPAESRNRRRKPKPVPFKREYEQAQVRKAEAEERQKKREEAEKQRVQKVEDRERFRKAMAKARSGGPNGQRKLGRESKVLLEKVKRMVGEDG